ncbi:MAG: hypothetical protein J5726_06975 [Treponema sp.]|nr:hypothetical protein [Treponema sp.]
MPKNNVEEPGIKKKNLWFYPLGTVNLTNHITAEGFRMLGTTHMHCLPEAGL